MLFQDDAEAPARGVPITPTLGALFAISFAGIAFVLLSRNARLKRIALPVTLLAFSTGFYLAARESSALANMPAFVLPLFLLGNAIWVLTAIRSCESCGRTIKVAFGKARPHLCPACAGRVGK